MRAEGQREKAEITPEMFQAGAEALCEKEGELAHLSDLEFRRIVGAVFLAMVAAQEKQDLATGDKRKP